MSTLRTMVKPGDRLYVFGIEGSIQNRQAAAFGHLAGVLEDAGYSYLVFTRDHKQALEAAEIDVAYEATLPYEDWLDGDITAPIVEAGLTIIPPWCDMPATTALVLHITPSLVFGTGAHPTTRRCLQLIERFSQKVGAAARWTALDLGCGTGILGLAALRLGAAEVSGCDISTLAVDVARANAERNGLQERVTFAVASARELARPADLVLANLPPSALDELLEHPSLVQARWIIASGMLRSHHNRLLESLPKRPGTVESFVDGCWYTALIRRAPE